MRLLMLSINILLVVASCANAETTDHSPSVFSTRPGHEPWQVDAPSCGETGIPVGPVRWLTLPALFVQPQDVQPLHPAAIQHSDAYQTRAKIHKYASFATLPLFAAEVALGQSLYNGTANTGGKRTAHSVVGGGIIGLVGVNTVTGAWNLFGEGRRDKEGRTLRLVHGLLMMASDAGFLATWASGPKSTGRGATTFDTDRVRHRNMAIASVSVGTAGYLLMLFGNH